MEKVKNHQNNRNKNGITTDDTNVISDAFAAINTRGASFTDRFTYIYIYIYAILLFVFEQRR